MSRAYLTTGRTRQKTRTRDLLLDATRALLATGRVPRVEEAAVAASVARATAYRYYPNQQALLVAALPELTAASLLGDEPPDEAEARLELVVDAISAQAVEHEAALRTMLRLSLEHGAGNRDDLAFRKGRRVTWIGEALAPLRARLARRDFDRLVHAIAAAVGVDALVWLTDIAGLSRAQAVDVMRWSSRALLRAALAEQPAGRHSRGEA